jgi:hypothetical protein
VPSIVTVAVAGTKTSEFGAPASLPALPPSSFVREMTNVASPFSMGGSIVIPLSPPPSPLSSFDTVTELSGAALWKYGFPAPCFAQAPRLRHATTPPTTFLSK